MDILLTIPFAAFLFLLGFMWPLPAVPVLDKESDAYQEDPDKAEKDYRKGLRRRAMIALLRAILSVLGGLGLLIGLAGVPDTPSDMGALALLTTLYGTLILFSARAERNRRLATYGFMAFCAFIVWRYADFRDFYAENVWAIYAALGLNYLFWWLVGRHYPPGSSDEIQVWGMES